MEETNHRTFSFFADRLISFLLSTKYKVGPKQQSSILVLKVRSLINSTDRERDENEVFGLGRNNAFIIG